VKGTLCDPDGLNISQHALYVVTELVAGENEMNGFQPRLLNVNFGPNPDPEAVDAEVCGSQSSGPIHGLPKTFSDIIRGTPGGAKAFEEVRTLRNRLEQRRGLTSSQTIYHSETTCPDCCARRKSLPLEISARFL
jgi:hypothetical protein